MSIDQQDVHDLDDKVLDEAAAWIARLRSDQATTADQQAFALWLAEAPAHKAAFDHTLDLWEAMGSAPVSAEPLTAQAQPAAQASVSTLHPHSAAVAESDVAKAPARRPLWANTTALAAVGATVMVTALVLLTRVDTFSPARETPLVAYETAVGTQRQIDLDDGSRLELNTNSRVTLSFDDDRRHLELERGEAYFAVAKDPERPFVVATPNGNVTAVGTAFNVNLEDRTMTVSVTEGTVRVAARHEQASEPTALMATEGQQVTVDEQGLGDVGDGNLAVATAWRQQMLIFNETRLTAALEELNRYLLNPVDTSHPSLREARVSGTFSLSDPETTLAAIIQSFDLQTKTDADSGRLRLYQ